MATYLDAVQLPSDCVWLDEFGHSVVTQSQSRTIGGLLKIQQKSNNKGRKITLNWLGMTRATLASLETLRDTVNASYTLVLGSRTFTVVFRHDDPPPIVAEPAFEYPEYLDDDWFAVTLKLMEV